MVTVYTDISLSNGLPARLYSSERSTQFLGKCRTDMNNLSFKMIEGVKESVPGVNLEWRERSMQC